MIRINYAHKISPQGESFQGFWIEDDCLMVAKPFATKREAQIYLGRNLKTWGDIQQFIEVRNLPFKVIRFNMSNRGCLVDSACEFNGDTCADDVYTAREVVLTHAYEMGVIPVPNK